MRRYRNSCLPVSSLPTELLACVFLELQGDLHRNWFIHKTWVFVTRVCHSWREVSPSFGIYQMEGTRLTLSRIDSYTGVKVMERY